MPAIASWLPNITWYDAQVERAARHVAMIPDGNRRWARERGLRPEEGHTTGLAIMSELVSCAFENGVKVFTFWWGSPANLTKRDPEEVAHIVACLDAWLRGSAPALLARWDASFSIHGLWAELCPQLRGAVDIATQAQGGDSRQLVVLMGYSGHDEIRAAVQEATTAGTASAFEKRLWTADHPPVDLVIRTGLARHLSAGFMLWSIGEASIVFAEMMWPDYTVDDLREHLDWYAAEDRRYGA